MPGGGGLIPGGGIPIGAPRPGPGGIPIGGPIGGRMPGGGPIIPAASGAPLPIGGGAPRPGGYCVGAPAMLAPAAAAATVPLPWGVITWRHRKLSAGTRAIPVTLTSLGGGPSTVMETRFSPRSRTRPRTRFSSRSGCFEFFGLEDGNNTQYPQIRFMCLSKALKVPMKMRPSCRMHLILKSMCCSILLLLPTVCRQIRGTRHHDIITTSTTSAGATQIINNNNSNNIY
uniref:Uncharacterized protein n=1 Tax=Amphiprion percula TaxID=161767 RepID=A0A3P8TWA2_AMPPE